MDVSLMPTQLLQRELIKPTGVVPSFLVMSELQKRVAMKQQGDARNAQGPTVAQQLVQQPTAFADGGVVKLSNGGGLLTDFLERMGGQPQRVRPIPPRTNTPSQNPPTTFQEWWRALHDQSRFDPAKQGLQGNFTKDADRWESPYAPDQATQSDARKAEPNPLADEGAGSTSLRAGIGAYAAGKAPNVNSYASPEMGAFSPAARPDFASVRAGISLPDRTAGLSRGIADMESRVAAKEKGNFKRSLMEFGLGALSSKSPFTAVGVGEAGLGALKGLRGAEAEQEKMRMEMMRAQGDVARMQGEGDRAGLQAASQTYGTQMQSADSADRSAVQMLAQKYGTDAIMRNADLNAAVNIYQVQEQTKAQLQAAARQAQARGDQKEQDRIFKFMRYIEDAEKRADASVAQDAKSMAMLQENPAAFEFMRAQRREIARQDAIMKMPPDIQKQFTANMQGAGGGQSDVVNAPPPNARIRQ